MLITATALKSRLGIANSADDTKLESLITGVSLRFAGFCDRVLERSSSRTEYHDSKNAFVLALFPVETLSLYFDQARAFGSETLLVANEDYVLNEETGLVRLLVDTICWPLAFKAVVAGGYVAAGGTPTAGQSAIPEAITRAALQQCEFEWKNHGAFGISSASLQGQSVSVNAFDLLPDVKATLENYRRIAF